MGMTEYSLWLQQVQKLFKVRVVPYYYKVERPQAKEQSLDGEPPLEFQWFNSTVSNKPMYLCSN